MPTTAAALAILSFALVAVLLVYPAVCASARSAQDEEDRYGPRARRS